MNNGLLIVLSLIAIFALYLVWDNRQWKKWRDDVMDVGANKKMKKSNHKRMMT